MEAKAWAPSRWSPAKVGRYASDVHKHALAALVLSHGVFDGNLLMGQLMAEYASFQSMLELSRLGVQTIGDAQRTAKVPVDGPR